MPRKKTKTWTAGVWMTLDKDSMWVWVIAEGKHSAEVVDCMWCCQVAGQNEQEALEKAKKVFIKEYNQGQTPENTEENRAA